jgi:Family of unknown function (DUF6011)
MAIKCGNCKSEHDTVDAVRGCYGNLKVSPAKVEKVTIATPASATEKQLDFIKSLASERDWQSGLNGNDYERCFDTVCDGSKFVGKAEASDLISALLALPKVATPFAEKASGQNVPEGYYAIDIDDTVKFYRVDRPTEGKWAGRTFVSVQASDEFHSLRNSETRNNVLAAILAQGPDTATARYGQLIGRCGVCNRTLTDEISRSLGIGPICRNK